MGTATKTGAKNQLFNHFLPINAQTLNGCHQPLNRLV